MNFAGKPPKLPPRVVKAFHEYVRSQPCLVCYAPATLHHVTGLADRMGRLTRREDRVVPLCPIHHQTVHDPRVSDPVSVEGLSHQGFYQRHGIDLMAEAERLWEKWENER